MTESGFSQLVTRLPAAFPTGTRPPAIAPTIIPSAIGVRIDETDSTGPPLRCSRVGARARPQGVGAAAQDDADRRDEERDRERRRDRPEHLRVAGPEHRQHEDQPDVVRLPDRPHRVVGVVADAARRLSSAGDQLPQAGAEVRAAENDVEDEAGQHEHDRERLAAPWSAVLHRGRERAAPAPRPTAIPSAK